MEQGAGEDSFFMKATLRGPSSDVAWVEPTTENSPAALVPLGDLPGKPPALGEWMWLLGARGTAVPAALRLEKEGFTLVGDRALEGLDLAGFEEGLAAAESAAPPWPPPPPDLPADYPVLDSCLRIYRLADGKTGKPVRPKYEEGSLHKGFRADNLDGDRYRWHALRLRRGGR